MTRLTLDAKAIAELRTARGEVEICDESGHSLGVFVPFTATCPPTGRLIDSPFSKMELLERSRDLTGRGLAEIWQDLGA